MKALIATLLLCLLPMNGCITTETLEDKQAAVEAQAWSEMCALLELETDYSCTRLMPPLVVYEPMREGLHGYYDGSDTIYINDTLSGTDLFETLMHEGIHYVHVQHLFIPVPGPAADICWSENEAWTLTGIYFNEDNSTWWRAYPHCWPYYADSQELRELGEIWVIINDIVDGIIWEN